MESDMPPKSKKQEKFMQAVKHNKSFADKVDVSQSDAKKVLGKHKGAKRKK
jgi:hypothetical protein